MCLAYAVTSVWTCALPWSAWADVPGDGGAPASADAAAPQAQGPSSLEPAAAPTSTAPSSLPAPPEAGTPAPATPAATSTTPLAPTPLPAFAAPSFASDPIGAVANAADLTLKMYGDTGFAVRDNPNQPWPTATSNPNVYAPGVWNSFFAPRIDLFGSADVDRLSFLTEVMFDGFSNSISVDIERVQVNYLVANWLHVRAGRSHLAWGYYNDTYHHGNLFELTASRPFSVQFEDSSGIILSHNVGVGVGGTFDLGGGAAVRSDVDVGNGRPADVTAVALQFAPKNQKDVNIRLRWLPVDGLILGVNGLYDVVPSLAPSAAGVPTRPETEELVAGAHAVWSGNHTIFDMEAFAMRHNPSGAPSTNLFGGFAELGYSIGAWTPYLRGEYIRFPSTGDLVYQYGADSAEGQIVGFPSIYWGVQDFADLRAGVKWVALPQLAVKLEAERLSRDSSHQEIGTAKVAFGF